jgi:HK97 family phage portal protein
MSILDKLLRGRIDGAVNRRLHEMRAKVPYDGPYSAFGVDPVPDNSPADAYMDNPWVYAGVKRVVDAVSQLPLVVYRDDEDMTEVGGPAQELIDKPNEFEPAVRFRRAMYSWLPLYGEAFILRTWRVDTREDEMEPPRRPPDGLRVLNPQQVKVIPHATDRVAHFEHTISDIPKKVHRDRILHISEFNPVHNVSGTGAAEALATTIKLDKWANEWNAEGFYNGGSHNRLLFSTERMDLVANQGLLRRFEAHIKRFFGKGNRHRALITGGGMEVTELGGTQADMEFNELRQSNVIEIAAALGIPPSMMGILEYANYSNMEVQERILWDLTIKPLLRLVESYFGMFLLPAFGPNLIAKHDLSDVQVLQANTKENVEQASTLYREGIVTVNEARLLTGIEDIAEPIEGGDELRATGVDMLANFAPDEEQADETAPDAPPEEAAEDWIDKALEDATEREVFGVLLKGGKLTDVQRVGFKQINARKQELLARRFNQDLLAILTMVETQVLRNLEVEKSHGDHPTKLFTVDGLLVETAQEAQAISARRSMAFQTKAVGARADEVLELFGLTEGADMLSPHVQAYLQQKVQTFAGNWPVTVTKRLRENLLEGVNMGETINELQDRVRATMGSALGEGERARALTIARTEATPAFNFGSETAYEQSGVVDGRRWLTAHDSAVRSDHVDAENEYAPIGQDFVKTGEALSYPGDPKGSPGNIINCRCTTLPVVEEGARANGQGARKSGEVLQPDDS